MGLDVHPIGQFHDERPSHTGDRGKLWEFNDDPTRRNLQLGVAQEAVWSLGKLREEASRVFIHMVVEPRYYFHVQELVKESATSSPLVAITNQGEIPSVHIHA